MIFTDLTVVQEDGMASWLEPNELIYNNKVTAYLLCYYVIYYIALYNK